MTGRARREPPGTYTLIGSDGKRYESAMPGAWGGHRGTKIYGRLDCASALRAIARGGYTRYRVFFADEETAVAAGYRPCARCCNDRYRVWKARKGRWRRRGRRGSGAPVRLPAG